MKIAIVDQGPELFWFVSNALIQNEKIILRHIQNSQTAEDFILDELPAIVILNGDDPSIETEKFISKMRNHVFARNTHFIVSTVNDSIEQKRALIQAGTGYILYRNKGQFPDQKHFSKVIKWFETAKEPDKETFEYKPGKFPFEAEFSTFGRMGWLTSTHCLIETNLDLNPGQVVEADNVLFEEMGLKDVKLTVIDKNVVGRYYQYANSFLCQIDSKNFKVDEKNLAEWVKLNTMNSKNKSVKMIFFEADPNYRREIRQMIKQDAKYCARGYGNIDNILNDIKFQRPQLILINRTLIEKDKQKFEQIKNYLKNSFCYCVTYDPYNVTNLEEYKKNIPYVMHSATPVTLSTLESMIQMLIPKMPKGPHDDFEPKVILPKKLSASRVTLYFKGEITEISATGCGVQLPISLSPFCPVEVSSQGFALAKLNRVQFTRNHFNKNSSDASKGTYHRLMFVAQTSKDIQICQDTAKSIQENSFDKWMSGDLKKV